jgi:hypothetical protein
MPSIRIGFSTDLNLVNEQVGIGTTNPTARLDVRGQIIADRTTGGGGITTLTTYDGFLQSQQTLGNAVSIASTTKGNLNSISGEIKVSAEVTVSDGTPIASGRLDSLTVTGTFDLPSSGTLGRETTPEKGSTRFNQDLGQLEFYTGYEWRTVGSYDGSGRGRGVFGGGFVAPTNRATIDYITISSTGNAVDFGTLTSGAAPANGSFASSTRGIFAIGSNPVATPSTFVNSIEHITVASSGNSQDFGDLSQLRYRIGGGLSSSTRGIFGGGRLVPSGSTNTIDYITIATIGNAIDFGDLTAAKFSSSACSSPTRGIFAGGTPATNAIDFITIASTGNAVDFGDFIFFSGGYGAGCSNQIRGLFGGGYIGPAPTSKIGYVTIATLGNAVDFGDLTLSRTYLSACASSTRGVWSNGYFTLNTIDYVIITSTGNAQDFGDSTIGGFDRGGLSDSHGGLGGF